MSAPAPHAPLELLLVEDREDDALLILEALRAQGLSPRWRRVDTPEAMREALRAQPWDAITSDYMMPRFTGRQALELLKAEGLDVPFIIVSGSVGEEVAVDAMRAGAHDFFAKARLTRLGAALEREVREARGRRARREAQAALARTEALHGRILASIQHHAIFALDAEGRAASWNPGVERVLGYGREAFLGLPLGRLFAAEEAARAGELLTRARAEGQTSGQGWHVRADGWRFWGEGSLAALTGGDGSGEGFTLVLADTSERKALVDGLEAAVTARDEFLSIASHELKTPVQALVLQLQRAQRVAEAQNAPLHERLGSALKQTRRLTQLINTLLDVSRMRSGRLALERERLDLGALAREVAEGLEDLRAASGSALEVRVAGPVVGAFDRRRLEGVVVNLLGNAFKFGAGRPVTLSVRVERGRAVLEVEDRGSGIAPQDAARLFRLYGRGVPETHFGGFGVGLWLVRRVVEAHGGRATAESEPGEGARFRVELPLEPPEGAQGT